MFMNELGVEVVYSTNSEQLVALNLLEERAIKNGVPLELLPRPIGEESLFKRATSSMATNVCTNETPILCRELPSSRSPKNTVVRVFEKIQATKGERSSDISQLATMFFDKKTGRIWYSILSEDGRSVVNEVLKRCNTNDEFSTEKEIRASILRAASSFLGVRLRKNGGVFFIPKSSSPHWDKYSRVFYGLGCVEFVQTTVCDDDRSKRTIYNAVENDVKEFFCDEILRFGTKIDVNEKLGYIISQFKNCVVNGNIKIDAWNNMVTRFTKYQMKINVYNTLIPELENIYKEVVLSKDILADELETREEFELFG